MAHSLEVREPLMDHPLVEWLATLPSSLKLRGGEGKWLLQEVAGAASAERSAVPAEDGLCRAAGAAGSVGRCARACARRCSASACRPRACSMRARLRWLVDQHQSGARDHSAPIWSLLMFDAFLRRHVSETAASLGKAA